MYFQVNALKMVKLIIAVYGIFFLSYRMARSEALQNMFAKRPFQTSKFDS